MFSVRDDPLARAVSLMGRVGGNRRAGGGGGGRGIVGGLRESRRASAGLTHASFGSLQDFRVSRTARRHSDGGCGQLVPAIDDGVPGMEMLRGVYTLTQISHITIDSLIFRLHSNATVILLVTFSIAVTTRQYVGNPIDCVHTKFESILSMGMMFVNLYHVNEDTYHEIAQLRG